jgi:YihY family inner membrane protein
VARTRSAVRWADRIEQGLPAPLRTVVSEARGDDILLFASGVAFYALVSIVPLAIVTVWVLSLVLGEARIHQLVSEVRRAAPSNLDVGGSIQRVANLGTSLGVAALITALWPASSYGAGLRRAFDKLSHKQGEQLKGLRGRGLAIVVILPIFVIGSLAGSAMALGLSGHGVAGRIVGILLAVVIGFAGTAVGVALIYRIFPPQRMPFHAIFRGTLWSATTITVLTVAFALVLQTGANFQEHYATSGIAILVLLAVWLFLANSLLLVGYKLALRDSR